MKREEENSELIVQQTFEESPGEFSSKNPMVLSCGGIYIPYNKRRSPTHPFWQVLNLASDKNPSKVVTSNLPRSPLAIILAKESLN